MSRQLAAFMLVVAAVLGSMISRRAMAQPPAPPAWFCTADGVVACFQPRNVSLLMPATRYVTLPSADWVSMSTADWQRFAAEFADVLPPEARVPTAPAESKTVVSEAAR